MKNLAGINFCESPILKNFAGINFRESPILKNFAGINIRESTFSRVKKGIYFREFGQSSRTSRHCHPAKISSLKVDHLRGSILMLRYNLRFAIAMGLKFYQHNFKFQLVNPTLTNIIASFVMFWFIVHPLMENTAKEGQPNMILFDFKIKSRHFYSKTNPFSNGRNNLVSKPLNFL